MGETVAVFGDGPFGLIFARLSMIMGARAVWVMGHHDWRLERIKPPHVTTINSRKAGFLPALIEATAGPGADLAIAAAGSPDLYEDLLASVRIQGRILSFAYATDKVSLDMSQVLMRELEIIGSCRCPHTFDTLIDLIGQRRLNPAELITSVLPVERLLEAFDMARRSSKEVFKILIEIGGES